MLTTLTHTPDTLDYIIAHIDAYRGRIISIDAHSITYTLPRVYPILNLPPIIYDYTHDMRDVLRIVGEHGDNLLRDVSHWTVEDDNDMCRRFHLFANDWDDMPVTVIELTCAS